MAKMRKFGNCNSRCCGAFPQAGETTASWRRSVELLTLALDTAPSGEHDRSDVNHLARAHASGVQFLITRDRRFTRTLGKAARKLGVKITSPGEFISTVWSSREGTYAPAPLQNTRFRIEPLGNVDLNIICPAFLDQLRHERSKDLAKRIRDLLSDAQTADGRYVYLSDGLPVSLMVRRNRGHVMEVPVLRLAGNNKSTIGRHVVSLQLDHARDSGCTVVKVTDPLILPSVRSALIGEGFQQAFGAWWAVTIPMLAGASQLAVALEGVNGVPGDSD